ncbi:MAG: NUMOD4 domain-containing protein [Bacteroidales bacterium]
MEKIWKPIIGYEGLYEVSNYGEVKSLRRICDSRYWRPVKERILKSAKSKGGYCGVILSDNKKKKRYLVARLVLIAFIPNPENKPQANHKDGDKSNNTLPNLEWSTRSENQKHAYRIGLKKGLVGDKCGLTKLTEAQVSDIRKIYKTGLFSQRIISLEYGVDQSLISYIVNRKTWRHIA